MPAGGAGLGPMQNDPLVELFDKFEMVQQGIRESIYEEKEMQIGILKTAVFMIIANYLAESVSCSNEKKFSINIKSILVSLLIVNNTCIVK
jgi:hypothetical protein